MFEQNITYKQVSRLQIFGDDNIFIGSQYQYNTSNSTVNNSIKMRFDLIWNLIQMVFIKHQI